MESSGPARAVGEFYRHLEILCLGPLGRTTLYEI